jgi:dihydrodipicolinate synthase/N-acetylneuraminate lyase
VGALAGTESNSPPFDSAQGRHFRQEHERTDSPQASEPASSASKPSSAAVAVVGNLKTRQKEVGFQVLVGAAHQLLPSLEAGAVGGILAFSCPAPTVCYEIYAAWKEGDADLARLKQERITKAVQRVGSDLGISGLKHAMDWNGYYGGPARLPLLPLTAEGKVKVEQLMADLRN